MLIAYLDEFGHIGPYVAPDHPKFNTHPVFGYAGFIIPARNVRKFNAHFEQLKAQLLKFEIERDNAHPRRWEKKGASLLTTTNVEKYDELTRTIRRLLKRLGQLDGKLVYYGEVKRVGSERETGVSAADRNAHCLRQILLRVGGYADSRNSDVMVVLDSTDDKPRIVAVETMASFIYASTSPKAVRRIVEVPMQVESHLYGTIQFADWLCALVGRMSHYEFVPGSPFGWAPSLFGASLQAVSAPNAAKIRTIGDGRDLYIEHLCDQRCQVDRSASI